MANGSIARRYARALMGIGVDQGNYDQIGKEVAALAAAMKTSTELAELLSNPAFPRSDRQKIIEAILNRLSASKITRNFALLLLERERMVALPDISRELGAMIDEKNGRVAAEVVSATSLAAGQLDQIKQALEGLSGKKVQISHKENPELLGGVIAKVGDIVYDGSLRTQLAQMRAVLAE